MKAFGLTGNIGCGKSTVSVLLSKYPDVLVFDCDRIAKEIISSGLHKQEINSILGINAFIGENANFKEIAKIIFKNNKKKRLFEELIHPIVWATVDEMIRATGHQKICVVESAIIYETKSENKFASVIVTTCNPEEQFRRLQDERKMNRAEIQTRIAQQIPSSKKEAVAQFVIRTDCNMEKLKDRVGDLYRKLKQKKGVQL